MEHINDCPVCGGINNILYLKCKDFSISKEQFNIVKCNTCSFLFTSPRPAENQIGKYYDSNVYISHHANKGGLIPLIYRTIRNQQFINKTELIKRYFTNEISILDIGCGTGNFLQYCSTIKWHGVGVEPDSDARITAKNNNVEVYNLDYLKQTEKKFDVITMWHVLEHVHSLDERMLQLQKLINPNGIIIVAVPNCNSYDAFYYKEYWAAFDLPRHLYHFTKKTIAKLFLKHNFNLVHMEPMKYDSFYVSIKSEEYKNKNTILNLINGVIKGLASNIKASGNKEYSSLIYVFKKEI